MMLVYFCEFGCWWEVLFYQLHHAKVVIFDGDNVQLDIEPETLRIKGQCATKKAKRGLLCQIYDTDAHILCEITMPYLILIPKIHELKYMQIDRQNIMH